MPTPSPRPRRRAFFIIVIVTAAIGLVLVGFSIYGFVRGPADPSSSGAPHPSGTATVAPSRSASTSIPHAPTLPTTNDPVVYARAVAKALFVWDTMSGLTTEDYSNAIVANADPTGEETAGLISDLAVYLPTDQTWQQLRAYQTRQSIAIVSVQIPASWPEIVASSGSELAPGTVAVTITGTRHRSGIWEGTAEHTNSEVSFTVFEICQPAYGQCHLLRLSQLNNPLN